MEEPQYDYWKMGKKVTDVRQQRPETNVFNPNQDTEAQNDFVPTGTGANYDGFPHRIRIRSRTLLKIIQDVTGFRTAVGPHQHTLVLFRPFKLLVASASDLKDHLNQVLASNGNLGSPSSPDGTFGPPKETDTDDAIKELKLLCRLVDETLLLQVSMRNGTAPEHQRVSFHDLWCIFKPGQQIQTPGKHRIQIFQVLKATGGRDLLLSVGTPPGLPAATKLKDKGFSQGAFIIECFYIDYDGSQFGPVNETFIIRKFDGLRDIESLPVFPVGFNKDRDDLLRTQLARGTRFAELVQPANGRPAHQDYQGLTVGERKEQVESQVIIDFEFAFLDDPEKRPQLGLESLVDDDPRELQDPWRICTQCTTDGCCGNDYVFRDYEVDEKEQSNLKNEPGHKKAANTVVQADDLTDDQKILLPCHVYGFTLRSRRWDTYDIDFLRPVKYGDGWDNLVINQHIRSTVLALVENHDRPQTAHQAGGAALASVDLVRGKGKGLIILLHGEPGVGKTSTAECVAEHTKRPLFPITCGDIGENARDVEESLETNFQLAHKWGCVLLLDEADIFLTKRNNSDVQRNAIVSVFLRSLEYYSGILFLTTNRVGTIDKAFKSRIHLSLFFPKLNLKRSKKVWNNNFNRLKQEFKEQNKVFRFDRRGILKFCERHFDELKEQGLVVWNGRQIRNAFQTAVAIANYEARQNHQDLKLEAKHFEKVAESTREFDEYLKDLHKNKTDDQLAREWMLRNDDWTWPPRRHNAGSRPSRPLKYGKGARNRYRSDDYDDDDGDSDSDEDDGEVDDDDEDDSREESEHESELMGSDSESAPEPEPEPESTRSKRKLARSKKRRSVSPGSTKGKSHKKSKRS